MKKEVSVELIRPDEAAHWAPLINAEWRRSVEGILGVGRLILEAKRECGHGEFGRLFSDHDDPVDGHLPFSRKSAHQLMEVASCKALSNVQHIRHLPQSWGTLYEISKLPEPVIEKAIRDGTIHPAMERKDVKLLKPRADRSPIGCAEASGEKGEVTWSFSVGDCQSLPFEDDTFDLVFCSPPYESQREYSEVGFSLAGDEFVTWAADCFMECLRVSRGLVAWVIEGFTENYEYSASPFLLMAEIKRRGAKLRKPVVYKRNGIPGTGGPDWLRNDWEPIICATKNGKLPWSDNTAMGSAPKQNKPRQATNRNRDGTRKDVTYYDPEICNPGNVIEGLVGSGGLGWEDAHQNEAPFPEWLAEFFIRSFCRPGGNVLDPFSGSGTTVAVAVRNGRNAVGVDARESQIWLGETRLMGLTVSERKQGQGLLI